MVWVGETLILSMTNSLMVFNKETGNRRYVRQQIMKARHL